MSDILDLPQIGVENVRDIVESPKEESSESRSEAENAHLDKNAVKPIVSTISTTLHSIESASQSEAVLPSPTSSLSLSSPSPSSPLGSKMSVLMASETDVNVVLQHVATLRENFVELEKKIDLEMENLEESLYRRQLYVRMELARLEFIEIPLVDAYLSEHSHAKSSKDVSTVSQLDSSSLGVGINTTLAYLDGLRYKMRIRPLPVHFALKLFYCLSGITAMFFLLLLLFPLTLLRLLHTPLMKMGVPAQYLPVDLLQTWFTRTSLAYWGVSLVWEGTEKIDANNSYIGMFNHQSSMDPWVVCAGQLSYRLIGKKTLFMIPLLGWLMVLWGHISIDRKNLSSAKMSFERALVVIKRYNRSIGVFPEGTRTIIGRPCDFKKGSFHTALQAKLPIVPTVLIGMAELWPANTVVNAPGLVYVKIMDPIEVKDDDTYKTLMSRVHRSMLQGYSEPIKAAKAKIITNAAVDWLSLPAAYAILYFIYKHYFN